MIISNYDKSFSKMFYLLTSREYKKLFDEKLGDDPTYMKLTTMVRMELINCNKKKEYYMSPEEIFVRINLLKLEMLECDIIELQDFNNLKDGLTIDNIKKFIGDNIYDKKTIDHYNILYFIDWGFEYEEDNKCIEEDNKCIEV